MIQINNISKYLLNVDISEKEKKFIDGIEHGDYPLRDRVVVVFNLLKHYLEDGAKVLMLDVGFKQILIQLLFQIRILILVRSIFLDIIQDSFKKK